ncbi:TIGR01777 family oxidoreductase [Chryseobacterium chendengshani]|uniref:TIGR01777 family oxidoreductase n=1 Tax=Chryseobacterium sp. LJ668 TaxID=2864040 RepID=UPI001C688B15|nr:TIGR01777 family oxidoreductase [Chryseobacterium sp. LJ668]MBW8522508.1 TIGR01777 family oxidoreductase [Chryseobacterium sp. LJ668]QYK16048.1 TIGR01777 family oxidoreductase [Chryseobacterium sp. LJ668]
MKEIVIITGAGGTLAKALAKKLENKYAIRFLTRTKKHENEFEWNIEKGIIDENAFENVSHIIHLAGANISEKKWTEERKKEIISSRVDSAQLILKALQKKNIQLKSFISASAVGIYGAITSEKIFKEDDQKGNDFLSEVVIRWEKAADEFLEKGLAERVVKVRTSIVLSEKEGALKKMSVPVKFGIGSPIGSGRQYIPWIHIDDICSVFEFALKNENVSGAYNASAPQHTDNENLTKEIAEVLDKPLFMPNVPGFVMKLIFGELAVVLLEGSRTSSEKLQNAGFQFKFPDLKNALEDLFKNNKLT